MSNYLQAARNRLGQAGGYAINTANRHPTEASMVGVGSIYALFSYLPSAVGALLGPSAKAVTSVAMMSLGSIGGMSAGGLLLKSNKSKAIPRSENLGDRVIDHLPTAFSLFIGAPFVWYFGHSSVFTNSIFLPKSAILAPLFTDIGAHVVGSVSTIAYLSLLAKDWGTPACQGTKYMEKAIATRTSPLQEGGDEAVDTSEPGRFEDTEGPEPTILFNTFLKSIKEIEISVPSGEKTSVTLEWGNRVTGNLAQDTVCQTGCLVIKSNSFSEVVAHIPASRLCNPWNSLYSRVTWEEVSSMRSDLAGLKAEDPNRTVRNQVVKAEEAENLDAVPALAEENKARDAIFCFAAEALRCAFSIEGEAGADLNCMNLGHGVSARIVFKGAPAE